MVHVSPSQPRSTIVNDGQGISVVIPARKNWFVTIFLGFWLCGWFMGEVTAIGSLFFGETPGPGKAFLLVWLGGWTLGGAFAGTAFLWFLKGCERITLANATLSIRREVFGIGPVREYSMSDVRDLRISAVTPNMMDPRAAMRMWGIAGGLLAFDHGASTIRFGAGVEESEAKMILSALEK